MHHRPVPKFKSSKIPHTITKVDRATPPSAAPERRSWGVPAHHAILSGRMRPKRVAPRRRGNRTVSGPHAPAQPGSAAPRQLHSIARTARIIEGYFCPPGSQSSNAAEDRRFPGTHTARTPHDSPTY
ncbi:hypothetical protein TcG_10879 [Trypanosoma cruzi]|nr:hypothetical protein TcG_10879 [Trypanosoma cruzi]